MPKNDLKDEEICSLVLKKTIRSQKGSGKEKNQSGKVGEEREEAENSWWLFKRQMGYISRAFREEKGKLVQEGDRPWELITYVCPDTSSIPVLMLSYRGPQAQRVKAHLGHRDWDWGGPAPLHHKCGICMFQVKTQGHGHLQAATHHVKETINVT